jgi:hypothetical protein
MRHDVTSEQTQGCHLITIRADVLLTCTPSASPSARRWFISPSSHAERFLVLLTLLRRHLAVVPQCFKPRYVGRCTRHTSSYDGAAPAASPAVYSLSDEAESGVGTTGARGSLPSGSCEAEVTKAH